MGRQMLDITNGDKGWQTNQQTGGIDEKTKDDLTKEKAENARNILFIFRDYDDPGFRAVSAGVGTVNDIAVDYVAVLGDDSESICMLGFNTETHQLVCRSYWGETMMGEGNVEDVLGDFKEISGVLMPMSRVRTLNGQPLGKIVYSEYVINGDVAPDSFTKPE
jgi:hypothetical protein